MDASVVAVVKPGRTRLYRGRLYREMLRESWSKFVWPNLQHEPLRQVWVIGRRVGRALKGVPGIDTARVISQPQDRNSSRYRVGLLGLVAGVSEL